MALDDFRFRDDGEAARARRAEELLVRLGSYSDHRAGALVALADDETPNGYRPLAEAGRPISAAISTRHALDYIADRMGRARLDRELRDYIWPRLRELGIVQRCYVNPIEEARRTGEAIIYGSHPVAKSANNAYVLTDEARALLTETSDEEWDDALTAFVGADAKRRLRVAQHDAAAAAAGPPETEHARLIRAAVDALQKSILPDYELVFIDDADGDRVQDEWRQLLEPRGLLLDLDALYPDAILVRDADRSIWFVDAVTSDGEVDETRFEDVKAWARSRGYTTAGATTAYSTWSSVASRQSRMQNLAVGSTLWIAEDGGKLFSVSSLAAGAA